mmetsp:Transcript_107891/g.302143  ORF Transcript_107891/g.302143 Transcript_107891/m.302143 type:complete len:243 (-) Transcript_107891:733-1461(-)
MVLRHERRSRHSDRLLAHMLGGGRPLGALRGRGPRWLPGRCEDVPRGAPLRRGLLGGRRLADVGRGALPGRRLLHRPPGQLPRGQPRRPGGAEDLGQHGPDGPEAPGARSGDERPTRILRPGQHGLGEGGRRLPGGDAGLPEGGAPLLRPGDERERGLVPPHGRAGGAAGRDARRRAGVQGQARQEELGPARQMGFRPRRWQPRGDGGLGVGALPDHDDQAPVHAVHVAGTHRRLLGQAEGA